MIEPQKVGSQKAVPPGKIVCLLLEMEERLSAPYAFAIRSERYDPISAAQIYCAGIKRGPAVGEGVLSLVSPARQEYHSRGFTQINADQICVHLRESVVNVCHVRS